MDNHPLIVLLGRDAVGKSTVAGELAKNLGGLVVKTPGDAWDGLRTKAEMLTPYARFSFYAVAVAMAMQRIKRVLKISPVILDRGIQCTVAFHAAKGVKIPDNVSELFGIIEPTLSVHLTVDPEEAKKRILARERDEDRRPDHELESDESFQLRVVENYRNLSRFGFTGNFLPVEISTDGKSPSTIAQEISNLLKA